MKRALGAALSEDRSTQAPVVYTVDRCGERHVISATLIYSFAIMWWVTILTDVSLEEAPKGLISSFMCKKFTYRDAIILPNRRSDSKANKIILFVQVLLSHLKLRCVIAQTWVRREMKETLLTLTECIGLPP